MIDPEDLYKAAYRETQGQPVDAEPRAWDGYAHAVASSSELAGTEWETNDQPVGAVARRPQPEGDGGMSELLPCPFCGGRPRVDLAKKTFCQLHGEPSQQVTVYCYHADCVSKPSVSAGDIFNGGEAQAREKVIAAWNRRAPSPSPTPGVVEALERIIKILPGDPTTDTITTAANRLNAAIGIAAAALASLSQPAKGECPECAGTGYKDKDGARVSIQRTPCSRGCPAKEREGEMGIFEDYEFNEYGYDPTGPEAGAGFRHRIDGEE